MHYLLVGNGECANIAELATNADVIVQINTCRHNALLPKRTKYVFLINSGDQMWNVTQQMPQEIPLCATIILAKNRYLYWIKRRLLKAMGIPGFETFEMCGKPPFPVKTISFFEAAGLEYTMRRNGMGFRYHPSTGMVAYNWLRKRLKAGDTLSLAGFTFEGWGGHVWAIERELIRPIL